MSGHPLIDRDDRRSRRTIRDLVALSTLPTTWVGQDAHAIARSLGDLLFNSSTLDVLYIRLADGSERGVAEVVRSRRPLSATQIAALKFSLAPLLGSYAGEGQARIEDPSAAGELQVAVAQFAVGRDHGVLVACSRARDFPAEHDRVLLGASANHAAAAMQRQRAEKDVREQRDWLEVTLGSIGDAVITVDTARLITFMNRAAEKLTGWNATAAKGLPLRTVFELVDESTRRPVEIGVSELPLDADLKNEAVLIDKQRAERPVGASGVPLRDASGKMIGAVITFRDMTAAREVERARRRDEEALRRSEEHLRAVVEMTPACIKLVGADGTLIDMNSAGLVMVDAHVPDEVRGKSVYDLVTPEHREAFKAFNERICRGETGTLTFEVEGLRGTRRRMETFAAPLPGPDGNLAQLAITLDVSERENAAQHSKLHGQVLESMVEGVSLSDETGIIVYTNPAEDRIFGYARGELIGQHLTVQNAYSAEENERIVAAIIERLKDEGSWSGEFRNRRKDGSTFTTHARITLMETGGKRYFVCVQEDVTERKQAEQALADARARLDAALEAGAIVTWTWDIPNNTLSSETPLARLFNLPASEAQGGLLEKYTAAIHPDDLPKVMATLNRAVERDEVYEADYRIVQADGSIRWVAARGRAQRDEHGRPVRMPGVIVDITQRKRLEEELLMRVSQLAEADRNKEELVTSLRESEEKLRLLADTIPQLAWMARPNGDVFWYNRRWYEYTGTTPAQMEGWGWQSVHDPETLPTVLQRWRKSIESGEPFDMVFPLKRADGAFGLFLTRVNPLRGSDGSILYWFGTNTDISEIKRMEQALRDADRRKDEFLATLAHELRNPLAPLRNSLEILKMPHVDAAASRHARETMERQVHALVRLVDDLLDVARVMRGKVQLRREPVELAAIVARAVETVQPLVNVQRHRLELDLPNESLLIDGDAVRLAQVIGNLLTNAAKYTQPNGRISLSVRREAGDAVIRVRDNGIGISPNILPHIFELFVQADDSFTKAQGGLGIGLTLVKNLAQLHGGSVEAASAGLGKGAEFILRLPVMSEHTALQAEEPRVQPSAPLSTSHRLLVVDDNEDAASSLAMLLRLHGHEVRMALDGRSALTLASSFLPNLVFLDIGMPEMDGYEVARRLRSQPGLESVMLVALTGWGQEEHRRRTAAAGFDHHLVKPLDPGAVAGFLKHLERAPVRC